MNQFKFELQVIGSSEARWIRARYSEFQQMEKGRTHANLLSHLKTWYQTFTSDFEKRQWQGNIEKDKNLHQNDDIPNDWRANGPGGRYSSMMAWRQIDDGCDRSRSSPIVINPARMIDGWVEASSRQQVIIINQIECIVIRRWTEGARRQALWSWC